MKLLFIRHAESESNTGDKTEFPHSISLTKKGFEQSTRLAVKIEPSPHLIVVTPYIRTVQTAHSLIEKYPTVPVETWPLHEFTFLSPFRCQNTSAKERLPLVNEYWKKCDPDFVDGSGAESFNQFFLRVYSNLEKLSRLNCKFVVIFTHGHVIRVVKQMQEKNDTINKTAMIYYRDEMLKVAVSNTAVLEIQTTEFDFKPELWKA